MSWDRDRTSSTSSASTPSSSSLPAQSRVRTSGLPSLSSIDQGDASQPSGERLRLPPLSSLISGSSSQYPSGASLAPPSKSVPSGAASSSTPRQEWSPIGYNHQGSRFADLDHSPEQQHASSPQRSDDVHRPFHHHQHHRIHQDHAGMTDGQQQQQQQQSHQHYVASQPSYPPIQGSRRSNSMSSSSAHSVSLPPLTSLTIQTSSRSPSLASASLTDREMAAPRHTPGIYSLHRSPLPPSSPSSKHSIGPSRRRYTGGSSSHTPYERPSPPTDAEHFDQVWDIYSYACRVNDEASDSIRQSYPTIAHLDLKSLLYHLHRELDELDQRNPRLSMQLAQDAGLTGPIKPSHMSPTSSPLSASVPHHQHGWMNALRGANEASLAAPRDAGGGNTSSYFDRGHMYRRDSRGESSSSSTTSPPLARVISSHPSYQHHPLPSLSPGGLKHASLHSAAGSVNSVYAHMTPTSAAAAAAAAVAASALPPKRVRKRKDEAEQSCLSCSATETPEWRKGPTGPRTLCNACGLLFAKQCRKKELDAQARGERPKGSRPIAPETMSPEEKERSLAELKVAVNARAANVSPPI